MSPHWSPGNTDLPASGVTAGTYGDATDVGQFTVNAAGQITAASNVAISGGGGGGGAVLDYAQRTTNLTVTATSAATANAWIDGNAVTYDGATRIHIEAFSPAVTAPTATFETLIELYDGATDLGLLGQGTGHTGDAPTWYGATVLTPSAGAHTFHVKAWIDGGASGLITAGAGGAGVRLPAFYRITQS